MNLGRREFVFLAGSAIVLPSSSRPTWAQAAADGPRASQLLRADLNGQGSRVEETVVSLVEIPPGRSVPWHFHPGAQELVFGMDGILIVEVEGQGAKNIAVGDTGLIAADVPHRVRNEGASLGKLLVVHSRSDKGKPLRVDVSKG